MLQTANASTYSEASSRSTLYVMTLSSSLVAMGFVAGSTYLLVPFAAISLPAVPARHLHRRQAGRNRDGKYAIPDRHGPHPRVLPRARTRGCVLILTWLFYMYQRWRFVEVDTPKN